MDSNVSLMIGILGSDNQVVIWDVGTGEIMVKISCHPDIIYSACWNWDGSQLLTTCKDKKMRIVNPRTGAIEEVGETSAFLIGTVNCLLGFNYTV